MADPRSGAERICATLDQAGFRALFAGGCVRDMLIEVPPKDYDIATDARPDDVAGIFEHTVPVGAAFGVTLVLLPEGAYEVATFRGDGPYPDGRHPSEVRFVDAEQDAHRRDFTINALFYDPLSDVVEDHVGGRRDLEARILRTVGEPRQRFGEDHLRLLRGVRFAARLGYTIEDATFRSMKELASLIRDVSAERVRDEILKMLTEGAARRAFELLDETALLEHVLPEVSRMKGVHQPPEFHPEGDVFEHTLLMLEQMREPTPPLALGVLLHDVGKPQTMSVEDRIRFNGHDREGTRIARDVCRRLRLPADDAARVVWLVAQHMRFAAIPAMRESKLKRFVRHEAFPDLLELCRLDCLASHMDMDTIEWARAYLAQLEPEEVHPTPLLTGTDLIAMGYRPGPRFGEILTALEDAQLENRVSNGEEARAFVRLHWPSPDAS